MNPTRSELQTALSDAFLEVTTTADPLTDEQLTDCFNKALDVFKTVNPDKGTPTVKF